MPLSFGKYILIVCLMLGGFSADFYSKKWAQAQLRAKPPVVVVTGLLDFGFAENRGMVFGVLNNKMPHVAHHGLVAIRALLLIGLTIFIGMMRKKSIWFILPFTLFWAGAIGNLIDPFLYGYVVDFIHMQLGSVFNWPFYYNLADAYITIGVALLVVNGSLFKKMEVRIEK
jgi:signal peptidase II